MENEGWKEIPGYPDYEASTLGQIRRATPGHRTRVGRILNQSTATNGYLQVKLGGKSTNVHTLIASTFLGPREDGQIINHINGDKQYNLPSNLQYCTQSDNITGEWAKSASDGLVTLTIRMPKELHLEARTHSYKNNISLNKIIVSALTNFFHANTNTAPARKDK